MGRKARFVQWLGGEAQRLKDELLFLVDEDTAAFNRVMAAFALPKESAEEKAARSAAIQEANKYAAEIPLRVMESGSNDSLSLDGRSRQSGIDLRRRSWSSRPRACIDGAGMNVRINLSGLKDEGVKATVNGTNGEIGLESETESKRILAMVEGKLSRAKSAWRNASLNFPGSLDSLGMTAD